MSGERVSYPSLEAPTRIACRLQRIGRGTQVELALGSKDGGTAKNADDVMFYELPASMELRIISRSSIIDVCCNTNNPLPLTD